MRLRLHRFRLSKAVPLAISRGTTSAVEHLLVELEHEGLIGRGETGGFDTGHRHYDTEAIAAELEALAPELEGLEPLPLQVLEPLLARLTGSGSLCRHQRDPRVGGALGGAGAA